MTRWFAPSPGKSPVKLAAMAALSLAIAAGLSTIMLDPDAGIPPVSSLRSAQGKIANVRAHKYGVEFHLQGHAEIFDYPSKARGNGIVESALTRAGDGQVAVLFAPAPRSPLLRAGPVYEVWQIAIDGTPVRSMAQSQDGWRADNALIPWLAGWMALSGLYLAIMAWRVHRERTWL